MRTDVAASLGSLGRVEVVLRGDVVAPEATIGRSTRSVSANTAALLMERLITQLELTTSTEESGSSTSR